MMPERAPTVHRLPYGGNTRASVICSFVLRSALIFALVPLPHTRAQTAEQLGSTPDRPKTTVQKENTESTAKVDDAQVPEANPARPTVTSPAHIPPVGYLQVEQGFNQANTSPDGTLRQASLLQLTKLSLTPWLMVQFLSQPIATTRVAPGTSSSTVSTDNNVGDLDFGVQGIVVKQQKRRPVVAVAYLYRARNGPAPDLDIGSYSKSAMLLVSGDLGQFHYDSDVIASEQIASDPTDAVRRLQLGETLAVTHTIFGEALDNRLSFTGELSHFSQPLVYTTADGGLNARSNSVAVLIAPTYTLRPYLVLDLAVSRGLTSTSTQWQGAFGFTYLLPHRLWTDHHVPAAAPAGPRHRRVSR